MKKFSLMICFLVLVMLKNTSAQNYSVYFSTEEDTVYYDSVNDVYLLRYLGYTTEDKDTMYSYMIIPENKVNPYATCKVSYVEDSLYYLYEYNIENGEGAKQNLISFTINLNGEVVITNKSTSGWFALLPDQQINNISWFGDQGLEPTWSTGGFAFSSNSLPGIGDADFRGQTGISGVYGELSDKIEDKLKEIEFSPGTGFVRKPTVVPVDLPMFFVPKEFIDTLITYKHQSYDLGWIDNQGIVNSLDKKLENAKKQIEKGKTKTAINQLNAFINEVEAQRGKHLTEEAYALLKYNAEYLIEQLEEQ